MISCSNLDTGESFQDTVTVSGKKDLVNDPFHIFAIKFHHRIIFMTMLISHQMDNQLSNKIIANEFLDLIYPGILKAWCINFLNQVE